MNFEGATGRLYMEKNGEMVELGEVHDFKVNVKSEELEGENNMELPVVTNVSGTCSVEIDNVYKIFQGTHALRYDRQDKKAIEALMRREKRRGRK